MLATLSQYLQVVLKLSGYSTGGEEVPIRLHAQLLVALLPLAHLLAQRLPVCGQQRQK